MAVEDRMTEAERKPKNWFARNWPWAVPLGCFGGLLCVAGVAGFVFSILFLVFDLIKSTDVCQQALARAREDPAVREALGTPVEDGFFVTGNIHISGTSGKADIAIPISGPKGKGRVYAVARKSAGRWEFSLLEVEIRGTEERINLLEAPVEVGP